MRAPELRGAGGWLNTGGRELSLSFDHRIVDGQLGSQFLADLAAVLTDPGLALAWS